MQRWRTWGSGASRAGIRRGASGVSGARVGHPRAGAASERGDPGMGREGPGLKVGVPGGERGRGWTLGAVETGGVEGKGGIGKSVGGGSRGGGPPGAGPGRARRRERPEARCAPPRPVQPPPPAPGPPPPAARPAQTFRLGWLAGGGESGR